TSLSALFAPLAFQNDFNLVLAGVALWGIGMGSQESIMRAGIATMISADKRASAYGTFGMSFGISWLIGSAIMGWLLGISTDYVMILSAVSQIAAVPLLLAAGSREHRAKTQA